MATDEQISRDIAEWTGEYGDYLDELIGLGLLFKYAVPKLREKYSGLKTPDLLDILDDWIESVICDGIKPTRALAMAIHKVIKEG